MAGDRRPRLRLLHQLAQSRAILVVGLVFGISSWEVGGDWRWLGLWFVLPSLGIGAWTTKSRFRHRLEHRLEAKRARNPERQRLSVVARCGPTSGRLPRPPDAALERPSDPRRVAAAPLARADPLDHRHGIRRGRLRGGDSEGAASLTDEAAGPTGAP